MGSRKVIKTVTLNGDTEKRVILGYEKNGGRNYSSLSEHLPVACGKKKWVEIFGDFMKRIFGKN